MSVRYTPEQKALLCNLYPTKSTEEIIDLYYKQYGETLTRSAVKAFAANHKLKKAEGHLTTEEIAFIKDNGAGRNTEDLTALFNAHFNKKKTVKAISALRYKHGAKSGLKTRVPNSGQFPKGHVPRNKGKKQSDFMSAEAIERTKATKFQKGQPVWNHKPIGSTRVNVGGYVEEKVAEPNKWRLKHQIVWEAAHGKVKKGQMITFLDGNKQNCSLENLTVISQSVNARLNQNHLRSKHPEVTKVAITLGKVIAKTHQSASKEKPHD